MWRIAATQILSQPFAWSQPVNSVGEDVIEPDIDVDSYGEIVDDTEIQKY